MNLENVTYKKKNNQIRLILLLNRNNTFYNMNGMTQNLNGMFLNRNDKIIEQE